MIRLRVCRIADVPLGATRGFPVPGLAVPVMITNHDGTLYATSSECPHEVVSLLTGTRHGLVITCPGHGYEFDLATGHCTHDPDLHLPRYKITLLNDDIWIDLIQ